MRARRSRNTDDRTNDYALHLGALKWGGTIDKFIGDAILVFFGDSETKGAAEDAKACVRMAVEMQIRLGEIAGSTSRFAPAWGG